MVVKAYAITTLRKEKAQQQQQKEIVFDKSSTAEYTLTL